MKQMGFVLLSGGIDSSTCLGFAVRDCGRENVTALSIDYGQRHKREIEQAKKVVKYMLSNEAQHQILTIEGMPKGGLTDHQADIPNSAYSEIKGVSPTYVPFRNGQLLSKAAAFAVDALARVNEWAKQRARVHLSAGARTQPYSLEEDGYSGVIYAGMHAEDAQGWAYPDCTLEFVGAMSNAIYIGTYHQVRVVAPLISLMKDEIIEFGEKLGVPWHLTWSCYKGEELHCGACPTCYARHLGFLKSGVTDPTVYAANILAGLEEKGLVKHD